jgi:hydrogenase-4 component B
VSLLLVALAVLICGGVAAAALSPWPRAASWTGAGASILASAVGLVSAGRTLFGIPSEPVDIPWHIPGGGIVLASDALSAFFLVPVFTLGGVAALYGRDYLFAYRHEKSLGVPWLGYNLLLASMVVVVTARHALLFLVAWEIMSLASYVLIVFEYEKAEVQRAGWVYLIAAHVGMAFLIAMFLLLEAETGTFALGPGAATLGTTPRSLVLLLAFAGFGVKAGLIPLHVWLPEAHAAAPSHVSALMSGVVIKMGIYGLVRTTLLTGTPPSWWGQLLVAVGLMGALYGISMASSQRDIKRVLAYSSIENVGLVALGLGLGFWGMASGRPTVGAFGLWGALLHVWNHTAMKGLLFLGAGTIVHATGTKDIERLGGLMRRMPIAAAMLVLGSLAIAGLPPLNGFVSEWLLYRSLLEGAARSAPGASVACMLALGGLSAVGALAALCFLRVCSVALLGEPRSTEAADAHEAAPTMLAAMGALAVGCLLLPAVPTLLARAVAPVATQIAPEYALLSGLVVGSLAPVGYATWAISGSLLVAALVALRARNRGAAISVPTWGCGYSAPTARMQYTGYSFAQLLVDLLPRPLRPRVDVVRPSGLFPTRGAFAATNDDPFTRGIYEPAIRRAGQRLAQLRWFQQGAVHIYLLYILVALAAGLAWASFRSSAGG